MSTATLEKPTAKHSANQATEQLVEFFSSAGQALGLDKEAHVIRGVKILGLESSNGRSYRPEALRAAIGLYEGARVNVNHPKGSPLSPRDYQDRLGHLQGVNFKEGAGLFGDLDYNPANSAAAMLEHDAVKAPQRVGLSHNAEARTKREGNRVVVESIVRVQSVDLVADPATTRSLFEETQITDQITEHSAMDLTALTLEQLRTSRPDLAKSIVEAHVGSEEQKAKEAELVKLKEQVQKLEGEKKARERRDLVDQKIAEAKLPEKLVTDTFRESCYEAADDAKLAKLIEDRQEIAKSVPQGATNGTSAKSWTKPQSRDQKSRDQVTEGADGRDFSNVTDGKSFAKAIRR
jgi:hypothetical protein